MSGPIYTYTSNTPNATDPMNLTQPLILQNFQAIQELLNINHGPFNSSISGLHTFLSLPFPSTATTPASTDINMYCASTPSGPNLAEIFYENSSGIQTQLSDVQPGSPVPAGTSGTGWCKFTTSELIMKWGTATVTTTLSSYISEGYFAIFYLPTSSSIPAYTQSIGFAKITPTSAPGNDFGAIADYNQPLQVLYLKINTVSAVTFSFNWFTIGK